MNYLVKSAISAAAFAGLFACQSGTAPAPPLLAEADPVAPAVEILASGHGVDISHHQDTVNWSELATATDFAFIKATGGLDYTDPLFQANWKASAAAGMPRGAYHFYYTNDDPIQQATWFLSHFSDGDWGDLPPVLDIESHSLQNDLTPTELDGQIQDWLQHVERTTGHRPIIYTGANFAAEYLTDTLLQRYPLWLAQYEVDTPRVPGIWEDAGWTFWQFSSSDSLPGVATRVDHSRYQASPAFSLSRAAK
jgi:lysozyme